MYTTSFVETPLGDLLERVQTFRHDGLRFVQMCGERDCERDGQTVLDLLYTFYDETTDNAVNLVVPGITGESRVPSIQGLYFAAFSYENETHDLYGVRFINMELDFGGHFFNVASSEPMTIISPEMKAEREKLAKKKAAAAAKADAAARKAREAAEAASAERALTQDRAAADAEAVAAVNAAAPAGSAVAADDAAADRAAKMEAKLAAMDPEKAAAIRAKLAARAAKEEK